MKLVEAYTAGQPPSQLGRTGAPGPRDSARPTGMGCPMRAV